MLKQVYSAFDDIHSFHENDDLPPSRLIFNDPRSYRKLKIELATLVEAGEPFVKATYIQH